MTSTKTNPDNTVIPRPVVLILAVLVFTAFVMMLNETTLAVALPAIMADYSIEANTAQWLLTGFMLTMAVVLPATGWILERFTTRQVFIFATAVFLLGTVIAALAPTFPIMLGARVAQAIGTAVIMPLLMTVAMTVVPVPRRGAVMGLISVVMAVGPALGPSVAGVILSVASWHMIFWVMVPLVGIAAVLGAVKIGNINEPRSTPFDVLSLVLAALAFGGLVYALSSIGVILDGGDTARNALIILAVGVVALVVFVWRQLSLAKQDRALLDLRPLGIRNYTVSLIVLLALFGALLGVMNTLPLYMQGSLLVSALVTGLVLLPGGLLEGVLSPFVGRIYDRRGPRALVITGMIVVVGSLFWLSTVDETTPVGMLVAVHVLFSIGLALLFTPLITTALGSVPKHLYGHGSAIMNTLQQLAGAAGTAVMIAVYSGVSQSAMARGVREEVALADGANSAFFACACVAVVALVFGLFITRVPTTDGTSDGAE
ncbi:drug resistance MFS transporter, drug:H+ antiporter-2 family [Corynebacterium efficiens YS-314]|uniref:Putative transport protein n=1 Tax=Corynebacterium efficiens (strain DSM 44549 / YS-314 / AJ 12310 / JCM 11189 / NBRC 100395) TaxID=196164 RepID=Q8FMV9_COREF|nr:MDR family MFS transporter [Corynebacterium efficiens]EEW49058.1 drug resistance MFS transporter, drug:H+ antiporter-2 family [Corynebacterium efficiens YS-314]BAC19200.1 putative transport protein [Corynebacterium efficiens YS-314]